MSDLLQKAQETLNAARVAVNPRYRPGFHLSVPAGWLNDPNGFGFGFGRYQLFYQFHPYSTVWGPMHWGHWSSEDLLHWREEPVALAPDEAFDTAGCYSGTSLEQDGKLYLMYTGVKYEQGGERHVQQQCVAESDDCVHFTKWRDNPVIGSELLPEGASIFAFRDPKLSRTETGYRAIVASKGAQGGQLLRYDSDDLHHWRYTGVFSEGLAEMSECPDCFTLDGRDVLIVCVMNAKEANLPDAQTVLYCLGDERNGRFEAQTNRRALDWGLDFYAPQTTLTRDGRRVLMGWALSWRDVAPTHTLGHGWAGMMTVPRECFIRGDRLCQQPVGELEALREHPAELSLPALSGRVQWPEAAGAHKELRLSVDVSEVKRFAVRLMETGDERFEIVYQDGVISVDRAACGYSLGEKADTCRKTAVLAPDGELRLHILVDVSIVEIFVGEGETVLTSLAFPRESAYGVSLEAEGKARVTAQCWDVRPEIMQG